MNTKIALRYPQIMRRISAACGMRKVTLIAASKTQSIESVKTLYDLGHRDFGENYAQEMLDKAERLAEVCPEIRWHFIGHLQTNKVKSLLPYVHTIHSIDSEKLAAEIDKRWRALHVTNPNVRLACFIEVNIDCEESKAGSLPDQTAALAATIATQYPGLELQGLMAIPAASPSDAPVGRSFAALRELEEQCRPHTLGRLSMGMSNDFELAIDQGATDVRIGTALFGARI